jgi:hypothetical protein
VIHHVAPPVPEVRGVRVADQREIALEGLPALWREAAADLPTPHCGRRARLGPVGLEVAHELARAEARGLVLEVGEHGRRVEAGVAELGEVLRAQVVVEELVQVRRRLAQRDPAVLAALQQTRVSDERERDQRARDAGSDALAPPGAARTREQQSIQPERQQQQCDAGRGQAHAAWALVGSLGATSVARRGSPAR